MTRLAAHFRVRRRYSRSVNLERDQHMPESLDGYVVTPRGRGSLKRIADSLSADNGPRAWTLTGVYGTGKSAFANLLFALFGPNGAARERATSILDASDDARRSTAVFRSLPSSGFVRAMAVCRREPLEKSIMRALARAASDYWARRPGKKPSVVKKIFEVWKLAESGTQPDPTEIPLLISGLAKASCSGVLVVIDELGKALEYAAGAGSASDLYLLQQLAELPETSGHPPVLIVGLLHQSFSGYGSNLSVRERAEWEKVQGRFEDMPFTESPDQLLRLLAVAIDATPPKEIASAISRDAQAWFDRFAKLDDPYFAEMMAADRIRALYPLHPAAAVALAVLCTRFGQNERSAFTFLAGSESHSLASFLEERSITAEERPLLRVEDVYDYFLGASRLSTTTRVRFHRWAEVQSAVLDARGASSEETTALKVIGTFNLVASSGPLRASRELVLTALCSYPADSKERDRWSRVLRKLVRRGVITYRKRIDEYRLWEGSDFDIDQATETHIPGDGASLAELLSRLVPLPPVVAQRHSYETGTLRYFDRVYLDREEELQVLDPAAVKGDGLLVYWLTRRAPKPIPTHLADGRPIAVVVREATPHLRSAGLEVAALESIDRTETALQTDGVARREVRRRLSLARDSLESALNAVYGDDSSRATWFGGRRNTKEGFNAALSTLCDRVYHHGPVLWNELINRDELTSQGARAQRELISALLTNPAEARLGIEGFGPDYSIYASVLEKTGIHRNDGRGWHFTPPSDGGLEHLWQAVEDFCLSARSERRALSELYDELASPPFGVKRGVVPIVIAAVLQYHHDDVSVYHEGSFLPILRPHHFELLVKRPGDFAVKHFELRGMRWSLFRDLQELLAEGEPPGPQRVRNATLLTVVRPLVKFAAGLPSVTRKATDLGPESSAVRDALLTVTEPDDLLFSALPRALGAEPLGPGGRTTPAARDRFCNALVAALRELQTYYDELLDQCRQAIRRAFGVRADITRLREDLRVRASYLVGAVIEPRLRSFVLAAADESATDQEWIESLAMIIADRPVESWGLDGLSLFEASLPDFSRRFASLESLHRDAIREGIEGFDARRITITEPSGEETSQLLWIDRQSRSVVDQYARRLHAELAQVTDEGQRRAVLLTLIEDTFGRRALDATDEADDIVETERLGERHA